ncbi:N-acetylneuraminate synthase family protein [candidate division KSB1 bacterium]
MPLSVEEDKVTVIVGEHILGDDYPPLMVAEAGVNHNGDLSLALEMVEAAREAGADAVKFQSFRADKMAAEGLMEVKDVEGITGGSKSSLEMYRRLELSEADHHALVERCRDVGIVFLSTPFDPDSVDMLDALGVQAFKISSGDLTNLPLIQKAAQRGRPVFLSTGFSELVEVEEALRTVRESGSADVLLLHCVGAYPPPDREVNLRAMTTLRRVFNTSVGLSDHSAGIEAPLGAVALGAALIEKHFTLDNDLPGPDHKFSLNPRNFKRMVRAVQRVYTLLGSGDKVTADCEAAERHAGRKSLHAARPLKAGETLAEDMCIMLKPADGIMPRFLPKVLGRTVRRELAPGDPVKWDDLE